MKAAKKRLYLDVCALCRPYDDQSRVRIRLETDAVYLIFEAIRQGRYELVFSSAHEIEIGDIEDNTERTEIMSLLHGYGSRCGKKKSLRSRAEELTEKKLGVADAAHLVYAEDAADCLISCDDSFVKKASRLARDVDVYNPVTFCEKEKLR